MEIFLDHYRHSPSKKTLIVLQKIIRDNFLANKQKSFPTLKGFQEKIGMQKESNRCPLFPFDFEAMISETRPTCCGHELQQTKTNTTRFFNSRGGSLSPFISFHVRGNPYNGRRDLKKNAVLIKLFFCVSRIDDSVSYQITPNSL